MPNFHEDLETLDDFHERAYNGEEYDPIKMREVWWRVVKAPETPGNIGAAALLMYSMKYFPSTEETDG